MTAPQPGDRVRLFDGDEPSSVVAAPRLPLPSCSTQIAHGPHVWNTSLPNGSSYSCPGWTLVPPPRPLSSASFADPVPLTAELLAEHGGTLPDGTVVADHLTWMLRTVRDGHVWDGTVITGSSLRPYAAMGMYSVVHVPAVSGVGT